MAINMADEARDKQRVGRLYTRMMDEFRGSPDADWARNQYGPDRAIREGQPVPDFTFSGLEDSTVIYRPADFRGHYLLIDFWAVWCGPCLGEMRSLHDAYAAYKGRGLTVLSVSFDPRRADVTKFRGGKWPMPWLHAFASQGFSGVEAKRFGVLGIPRPILVDPEGKIVAMENDLRGDRLEPTLARLLGPGANGH
ncbi:MAG: TlpA family protein disulfide reductase [Candidatus Eisenbacteria bacterium]|uniref:TlpA family protein disulfide reductase n=1 Tax=Eiseniibacteriota bacterium TaxID=2212470 RepID=A0A538TXW2_UNCEI|nr:MAG: TlpA family protein disulfide reductase [Candidatus Eisenbacteria bacterium]